MVVGYEECYSKFYVAPTFRALLENCYRFDLDTCVRRLVTGELLVTGFWSRVSSVSRYLMQKTLCEGFALDGVDYKLLELF